MYFGLIHFHTWPGNCFTVGGGCCEKLFSVGKICRGSWQYLHTNVLQNMLLQFWIWRELQLCIWVFLGFFFCWFFFFSLTGPKTSLKFLKQTPRNWIAVQPRCCLKWTWEYLSIFPPSLQFNYKALRWIPSSLGNIFWF